MDFKKLLGRDIKYADEVATWIKEMSRRAKTRCILHNIFARELIFRNLDLEILADFFDRLGELIASKGMPLYPEKLIWDVADQEPDHFYAVADIHPPPEQKCSRIMSVWALLRHYASGLDYPLDNRGELELADDIEVGAIQAENLSGTLSGKCPFLGWVTRSEEVETIVSTCRREDVADTLRDGLGLVDYDIGTRLVEIKCPDGFSQETGVAVPTVLDADENALFRPAEALDGWGKAVDLGTLDDGMSEAVHRACAINRDYDLRLLGIIDRCCPSFTYQDVLYRGKEQLRT